MCAAAPAFVSNPNPFSPFDARTESFADDLSSKYCEEVEGCGISAAESSIRMEAPVVEFKEGLNNEPKWMGSEDLSAGTSMALGMIPEEFFPYDFILLAEVLLDEGAEFRGSYLNSVSSVFGDGLGELAVAGRGALAVKIEVREGNLEERLTRPSVRKLGACKVEAEVVGGAWMVLELMGRNLSPLCRGDC